MGKKTEIICDGCGKDITRTTNCEGYLLCLDNRSMPTVGGLVTSMGAYPVLERDYYVCSLNCLLDVVEPWRLRREASLKRENTPIVCPKCSHEAPRRGTIRFYRSSGDLSGRTVVHCHCRECGHDFSFDEFNDPLKAAV